MVMMKKYFLFIAASLLLFPAFAQKTDTKLLTGKWNLRYFSTSDFTIDADHQLQTVTQRVKVVTALAKEHILSEKDSVELVAKTYVQCRQIDSSSFTFKANGDAEVLIYLPIDGEGGNLQKATYKWMDKTHVLIDFGDDKTQLTVTLLDAKHLEVQANEDKDPGERITLKFTR